MFFYCLKFYNYLILNYNIYPKTCIYFYFSISDRHFHLLFAFNVP